MSLSYTWGPDSHIAQMGVVNNGVASSSSLGWDGDDLLYSAQGNQLGVAIEKLGIVSGTSFSIYDRDWSGGTANVHETGGYTAVQSEPWKVRCNRTGTWWQSSSCNSAQRLSQGGPSDESFSPMTLGYPSLNAQRSDGYSDGINTFQGVRAYDPNMNQWTTPDAYAGDVHDPMSQKPYMWNGNNPVQYSDPSGYVTYVLTNNGFDGTGGGLGHTMVIIQDPKDHSKGVMYSWRPVGGLAGSPGQVDRTPVVHNASIASLLKGASNYNAFKVNTTAKQDAAIRTTFMQATGQNFNLATNSCNDKTTEAFRNANSSAAGLFALSPSATNDNFINAASHGSVTQVQTASPKQ